VADDDDIASCAPQAMENMPRTAAEAIAAGLTRYFSGKPCPQGHIGFRAIHNSGCCECMKRRIAEWHRKNKERSIQSAMKWQKENKARYLATLRRYEKRNPEKVREWNSRSGKKYRSTEKGKLTSRISRQKRRALQARAVGSYTMQDFYAIFELQKGKCAHCLIKFGKKAKATVDHIVPISRGGMNDRSNLQLLCGKCNSSKGTHDWIDFSQKAGRLL
jgi:5-methylcytosine-specific restriction endonuclease McrA